MRGVCRSTFPVLGYSHSSRTGNTRDGRNVPRLIASPSGTRGDYRRNTARWSPSLKEHCSEKKRIRLTLKIKMIDTILKKSNSRSKCQFWQIFVEAIEELPILNYPIKKQREHSSTPKFVTPAQRNENTSRCSTAICSPTANAHTPFMSTKHVKYSQI